MTKREQSDDPVKYRVLEIYEADFGCEERPEGQETMVMVRLQKIDKAEANEAEANGAKMNKAGAELVMSVRDAGLTEQNIEEGDLVWLREGDLVRLETPEEIPDDMRKMSEKMPEKISEKTSEKTSEIVLDKILGNTSEMASIKTQNKIQNKTQKEMSAEMMRTEDAQ
ncbi:hypothetical protein [Brotaphodocola sp.]|uniref:hypothetical protein n=1 Tax=Brotaphodocola sp. TaxID=3073577 RepID=UPI003D7D445C